MKYVAIVVNDNSRVEQHSSVYDNIQQARDWTRSFLDKTPKISKVFIFEAIEEASRVLAPVDFKPVFPKPELPLHDRTKPLKQTLDPKRGDFTSDEIR